MLALGVVVAAYAVGTGGLGGAARGLATALLATSFLLVAVLVACVRFLPLDRAAGRSLWLSTLRPGPFAQRLGAALAGWVATCLVGLGVGAVLWVVGVASPRGDPLFVVDPTEVEGGRVLPSRRADEPPVAVALSWPAGFAGGVLELDVRARMVRAERPRSVAWSIRFPTRDETLRDMPPEGLVRLELPHDEQARGVTLTNLSEVVDVRLREARLLEPAPGGLAALRFFGPLGLAFVLGALAPIVVLLSRFTTSATAASLAVMLVLMGTIAAPLASLVEHAAAPAWALGVLNAATWLVPRLPLIDFLGDLAEGRLAAGLGAACLAAAAYGGVGLALLALPGRDAKEPI